jgi:hypothetical protein
LRRTGGWPAPGVSSGVLIWNPSRPGVGAELSCAATALAIASGQRQDQPQLVLAHYDHGVGFWLLPCPYRSAVTSCSELQALGYSVTLNPAA